MKPRKITENVHWLGAVDWDRRLFDQLIPLPDGTSYNAYLVRGRDKTVLLDTVDPPMRGVLLEQLKGVGRLDYLVAHHAEQDHSGSIPDVLAMFPDAKLVTSEKAKGMLMDLLRVPEERFKVVADGETLDLGGKTLKFIYTPWVHWPETFVTYLAEDKILFSCDFFGSHLATSELYADGERVVAGPAKRYYAEIMMPFAGIIAKNLKKLEPYEFKFIAPSHGPIHSRPEVIVKAYDEWVNGEPKNVAVLPFVSMHGSTLEMVNHLTSGLAERGVRVERFDLASVDIGALAMSLVDAATIIVGTPTVLAGPHPLAAYATLLANALRPKARFLSIIGSYGWGGKTVETLASLIPNLKVEVLAPVLAKGLAGEADFEALDRLADAVAERHKKAGLK
ncbi:MAG: FprA family A-type flavoprotein [bacterium]|nr:FprA family A-type flavoprotein [bacterium]